MPPNSRESGIQGRRPYREKDALDRAAQLLREAICLLDGDAPGTLFSIAKEDRLVRLPEVLRLTGLCRSALYDQMSQGEFPRAIKIGPRAASWSLRSVHHWISQRAGESQ
jgi:prophage regulatory protein